MPLRARRSTGKPAWPIIPDGIHHDLPETDYYRARALSQSTAKQLIKPGGPAKVKWDMSHGRADKREFDLGHAAHSLVLGVGAELVDIGTDLRTKAAREADAEARKAGQIPLRSADYRVAQYMADELQRNTEAMELLQQTSREMSLFHTHHGVQCKGRVDIAAEPEFIDYKTSQSADERRFANNAADFGYHIQAAAYPWLAQQLGQPIDRFRFIVQEVKAPYLVNVIELDDDFRQIGLASWLEAIELWRRCTRDNHWPGYAPGTKVVHPPRWLAGGRQGLVATAELDPSIEAELAAFLKGEFQ